MRKSQLGSQEAWTKEQILAGLQHYYKIHGHYPTARDIDVFEYLPSSRSIQRQHGGLVALRQELIPDSDSDYTRGPARSARAKESWDRAVKYEEEFYSFLVNNFDPVAVHEHKVMRPGNINCDYYIYLDEDSGIVIDLFFAKDLFSLANVVNIKLKNYRDLPYETIFVLVGNDQVTIQKIQEMLARKITPLPSHITVDTEANFKKTTIITLKQSSKFSRSF